MKFNDKYLDSVDWGLYIEREQPLFMIDFFVYLYNDYLEKESGFTFIHDLTYYKDGIGAWYKSKSKMEQADVYFFSLIKNNDSRIDRWLDKEKGVHAKAKRLLSIKDIERFFDTFAEIVFYNTVIPYRLLSALEGKEGFDKLRQRLEKIRLATLWAGLLDKIIHTRFKELSSKYKIPLELFVHMNSDEIIDLVTNGKKIPHKELIRRKEGCYFYKFKGSRFYLPYKRDILIKDITSTKELKGVSTFKGKVKGKVKIINSVRSIDKMQKGDIIVSINSNPSLMPAISKAAAIVADEGGMTCHAAIISRELKIPCVIGTKFATKIFKDGDMIEVDANKGVVRKI